MSKYLFFLIFIVLISCTKQVDIAAEKAEVQAVLDQYTQILKTENLELLSHLTAHDADMVNFGTSKGERLVGWTQLENTMKNQFETTDTKEIEILHQMISLHTNGKVAWFSQEMDWTLTMEETEVLMQGLRVTGVLENRDGSWLFVQLHFSMPTS